MKVAYVILPEEEYFEKLLIDLSSGGGLFDVYMTSPMFEWRYQYAGWIEDLNVYHDNPKLTDKEWYNRDDFYAKVLEANTWDGTIGGGLGKGRWNGIPVMVEFYVQAFREDLRQKWGLGIAKTYPELLEILTKAAELGKEEKPRVYGAAERGIKSWSTVHSGYFTAFSSYGQRDVSPELYATINTPEGIEITKIWIEMLQKAGDPGWPNYTWYDAKQNFASGRFFMINDCDFFAATYENPAQSQVVGKIGYALPPAGPDGLIKSNMWTWSLGMSSFSKHKEAAWLFLLWATAPRTMLDASLELDNFNPTRQSVWENPGVVEKTMKWGSKPGEYREVVDAMYTKYGDVAWTPNPDVTAVGDMWAEALHQAYEGKDVKEALDDAAKKIDKFMEKWRKK
jgi:multiple sugar transport system substrate-binding protein